MVFPYAVSAPRKVMVPYTSPDGIRIPTGNWVAIPQASVMRDVKAWSNADSFEGFRFVDGPEGSSESRLTHPSYDFPFWGAIRHAWYVYIHITNYVDYLDFLLPVLPPPLSRPSRLWVTIPS